MKFSFKTIGVGFIILPLVYIYLKDVLCIDMTVFISYLFVILFINSLICFSRMFILNKQWVKIQKIGFNNYCCKNLKKESLKNKRFDFSINNLFFYFWYIVILYNSIFDLEGQKHIESAKIMNVLFICFVVSILFFIYSFSIFMDDSMNEPSYLDW